LDQQPYSLHKDKKAATVKLDREFNFHLAHLLESKRKEIFDNELELATLQTTLEVINQKYDIDNIR
jgi:hypothetical protein